MSLSVAMIVRDEQSLLPGALSTVGFADELIIGIDDQTTDATERIARKASAKVHWLDFRDDFGAMRNVGLAKATKDWVLVIDADDRLTDWGTQIIREVMRRPRSDVEVYGLLIENRKLDGTLLKVDPLPATRLFPNHQGIHYVNRAHETLKNRSGGDLQIGWLRGGVAITHYGYDPTLYELRHKDDRNMALLLMQLEETPEDRLLWFECARQHVIGGRLEEAHVAAQIALDLPGYLRPELVAELEAISRP